MCPRSATLLVVTALSLATACSSAARDWEEASALDTIEAYQRFLERHPQSNFAPDAVLKIRALAWREAERVGTFAAYRAFLESQADSLYAEVARERIECLSYTTARMINTVAPAGRCSSGPVTALRSRADTFVSWADLRRQFGWDSADGLYPAGAGATLTFDSRGQPPGRFPEPRCTKTTAAPHTAAERQLVGTR